jgi:hypothetical protein
MRVKILKRNCSNWRWEKTDMKRKVGEEDRNKEWENKK